MRLFLLPFLLSATLCLSSPTHAQMGTMKWKFKSRSEVIPALKKTRGNLRNTYDVLICSVRQGYINTALGYYESIVLGHEFSATVQDSAAFAFAHDLADGLRPWHWKKDRDYSTYQGSNEATTILFRDRAFKQGSNSPEILIMRAYKKRLLLKQDRKLAFEYAQKAVRQAPKWADAHYWLAEAAETYALSLQGMKSPNKNMIVRLGKLGMRSYDTAEKLDPGIRPYLYMGRINSSRLIADKKAAQMIPVYLDAHLRAFPQYAPWYKEKAGKDEMEIRAMYKQIADDIAKEAKS